MMSRINDAVDDQMGDAMKKLMFGVIGSGFVSAFGFTIAIGSASAIGIFFGTMIAIGGTVIWFGTLLRVGATVIGHSVKAAIIEANDSNPLYQSDINDDRSQHRSSEIWD